MSAVESGQWQGSLHKGDTVVRRAYGRWMEQGPSELLQGRVRGLMTVLFQPTMSTDHRAALLGITYAPPAPQQMHVHCSSHFINQNMMYYTHMTSSLQYVTINNLGLSTLRSPQNPTLQVQKCKAAELVSGSWHMRNASKN